MSGYYKFAHWAKDLPQEVAEAEYQKYKKLVTDETSVFWEAGRSLDNLLLNGYIRNCGYEYSFISELKRWLVKDFDQILIVYAPSEQAIRRCEFFDASETIPIAPCPENF